MPAKRTREQVEALIEKNQEAYSDGWLQPDQFAYNIASLSAELDERLTIRRARRAREGGGMSTVHFTVRMPAAEHAKLVKLAERELSSLNREITIAVRAHLDADRKRGKQ
jgi:hypothetical protein